MLELFKNIFLNQFYLSFDVEQIKIHSLENLPKELDETFLSIKQIYYGDNDLVEAIEKIHDGALYLLKVAPLYDLNAKMRANGFWTHLILIVKFGKILHLFSHKFDRKDVLNVLEILHTGLTICRKIHCKEIMSNDNEEKNIGDQLVFLGTNYFEGNNLFASSLDIVDLLNLMKQLKSNFYSLYASFNFCWLHPSMVKVMQIFTAFMAIYSTQWKSLKFYNWFNRTNRAIMFTNMSQNVNIDCLSSMWNINEYYIVKKIISVLDQKGVNSRNIYIPRQKRFKLDLFDPVVHDLNFETVDFDIKCKKSLVRAVFYQCNQPNQTNKSLMFHVHGGGYISQSPESHEVYLKNWVKTLKTVPILSIDYSLSPESAYPEALQEVLDCYLWVISKDSSVKEKLGFFPEKIAVCGDSAGGNLLMALLLSLSNICTNLKQRNLDFESYKYPNGIFCFYTPFLLMTIVSPSRLICSIDGLIPVGSLLNCLAAYVPDKVREDYDESKNRLTLAQHVESNANNKKQISMLDQIIKFCSNVVSNVKQSLQVKRIVPWYKRSENLKKSLANLNQFLSNPFISPLLAKDFDFDHIPLYLYPLTYDSFLDDSIEMAKKWRGKVHLEVIDGLPHGFLNLVKFSDTAKDASLQCISHVLDVLE